MNLFSEIDRQFGYPITEFGLQLAILRIDQFIEMNMDQSGNIDPFIETYIQGWLYKIYQRIGKKKSLFSQIGSEDRPIPHLDELKDFKPLNKIYPASIDCLILFPTDNRQLNPDKDEYLKSVLQFSKSKNIQGKYIHNSSDEYGGVNGSIKDDKYVMIYPLDPMYSSKYNFMEMEYINNISSAIITSTDKRSEKKFLISCEKFQHFTNDEKIKFYRSFIRSILLANYITHNIKFSNIHLHSTSEKEKNLFNETLIEITQLLKYHYSDNSATDWKSFISKHPYVKSRIITSIRDFEPTSVSSNVIKPEIKIEVDRTKAIKPLQQTVSTEDQVYQEELFKILSVINMNHSMLLLGESGTGKSTLAKAIHKNSNRSKYNFIEVNCSALSEHLIESELFGHVKGSFTGATNEYKGKIKAADKGTLFIDEIGKTPLNVQVKLLKFLDLQTYYPVGGENEIKINTKVIFATNEDPLYLIKSGRLLPDLYFRISKLKFRIPSLSERKADLENFIYYFKRECENDFEVSTTIKREALDYLLSQTWPGNIRQIENTFYQLFAECKVKGISEITIDLVSKYLEKIPTDNISNSFVEFENQFSNFFDYWYMLKNEFDGIDVKENQINAGQSEKRKNKRLNTHSFLKLIIEPLAANIYSKSGKPINEVSQILGLSLGSHKEKYSPFYDKLKLFPEVKEVFDKFE